MKQTYEKEKNVIYPYPIIQILLLVYQISIIIQHIIPFSERKGYTAFKSWTWKCIKFVCLSVQANQKRDFLF